MNGCGKSTMTAKMNRRYYKINQILPEITNGADYNFYTINGLSYVMEQTLEYANQRLNRRTRNGGGDEDAGKNQYTGIVWDRDRYSNLRFYFVHYLMYEYRNGKIPMPEYETLCDPEALTDDIVGVYDKLNALAVQTNLLEILTYFEHLEPSPSALIVVNHDLFSVARTLVRRGNG